MIFPARHFRLKVAGAGSIMEGEDAPTTKRTEASVFKRRSEISQLSSARPGSTEYWSDIRALVRHLEPKLA